MVEQVRSGRHAARQTPWQVLAQGSDSHIVRLSERELERVELEELFQLRYVVADVLIGEPLDAHVLLVRIGVLFGGA